MTEFRTPLSGKDMAMLLKMVKHFRYACGWLSEEELTHLEVSLKSAMHVEEVLKFRKYVVDTLPANELDGEALNDAWDKFYETDWVIGYGDMLITFPNGATIYNYITEFLDEYIQHEL